MKKLFALLLAVLMLLSTIPFAVSADDSTETFVSVDSIDDFYAVEGEGTTESPYALVIMLGGETNYRLMTDITFGGTTTLPRVEKDLTTGEYTYLYTDATKTTKQTCDWDFSKKSVGMIRSGYKGIFDGNGHSIVYTGLHEEAGTGSFFINNDLIGGSVINLTLGSKEQPIQYKSVKQGGCYTSILAVYSREKKVVIENVTIYADMVVEGKNPRNVGLFFSHTRCGTTINNCRAYGTVTLQRTNASLQYLGGFVGLHMCDEGDNAPLIMNNCYSDVDISLGENPQAKATSGAGGLVGTIQCKQGDNGFFATNCVAVGELPDHPNVEIGQGRVMGNLKANVAPREELVKIIDCQQPLFNAPGASVKIADGTLRFRVGAAIYNKYVDEYGAQNVKTGVIYAEKATATTLGDNFKIDATGVTNVEVTELENGYFYANVTAASYGTEYTALGYVSYTTDGGATWTEVYADAATTRSVSAVATAALADVKDVQGDGYGYATADGKYCFYTTEQQAKLASYIVASAS